MKQYLGVKDKFMKLIKCDEPIQGRYLTIHYDANKSQAITLCELEVFEDTGDYLYLSLHSAITYQPIYFWKLFGISDAEINTQAKV